ncbi:cation transporter [Phycicoccus avicenniae]|uniref:cation transporter n=1 Tax=Phycicoccus avicenniae TaxID=2828860 RepID=UPI003D2A6088
MATTQEFHATGLTCGHCAQAVTDELTALDGVREVGVEVVAEGASTVRVTADRTLTDAEVSGALDEAGGYVLARA